MNPADRVVPGVGEAIGLPPQRDTTATQIKASQDGVSTGHAPASN
jgi:hypothetical protein